MNFKLDTNFGYNKDIHKSKIIKYKPNNLATMNSVNTNINIILNREENHLNLHYSYLEIEFVVSNDAGGVFAYNGNIGLVNYGMMALFSSVKLETNGGRTIEYIAHCHPNLMMYKLLTSTDDEYESGFVRKQGNRDSQIKGDHIAAERGHMYMMIKTSDLFGFVKDLESIIYGLVFKLILKRNNNDIALYRVIADPGRLANDINIDSRDISWCLTSIAPSNDNRIIVQRGLTKKNNVDFSYYERYRFYKNVPKATNFLFDLGLESGMERPQYIIVGFENNNFNEQTNDASTFDIVNVTECYCKIGSEFYPEDRMNINYGANNYNEAFKEIVSFNKDYNELPHNIKQYINHRTFKSNYRIYVLDTRYQSDHIGPQPIQLNFTLSAAVADVICHALVLTRKVISVNSDGNKMIDIVS